MKRIVLVLLVALVQGCASSYFRDGGQPPEPRAISIESWPHPDLWTGVVFNGQKIGFTRRQLRAAAAPGRWEIESEAVMRIQFLGVDKRIRLYGVDTVAADLTLQAFQYEHEIDGNRMEVNGSVDRSAVHLWVKASGGSETRSLKLESPVYPSSALAFLPLQKGIRIGARSRYTVFHGETQQLAEAEQDVLAYEASEFFEGAAFKVETRLLGLDTTTWIAPDGRPLFETGMRGVIISALEDEAHARHYLVEASLNKRDAMVDFSLLRAGPIDSPRRVSRMDIVFLNFPKDITVPSDGGQTCARAAERLECRIDRAAALAKGENAGDAKRYLAPTLVVPSNLHEISDLAKSIAAGARDDDERVARLLEWMDANIAKEAVDAFTASDVLRARKGECQGHAYLFAAFARALGIPTRIVNGIVYAQEHGGFLYHSWNEAWIAGRGWQPVDATFGQRHADATHVKLIEGETAAELVPIVQLVGRVKVGAVSALARW